MFTYFSPIHLHSAEKDQGCRRCWGILWAYFPNRCLPVVLCVLDAFRPVLYSIIILVLLTYYYYCGYHSHYDYGTPTTPTPIPTTIPTTTAAATATTIAAT